MTFSANDPAQVTAKTKANDNALKQSVPRKNTKQVQLDKGVDHR